MDDKLRFGTTFTHWKDKQHFEQVQGISIYHL